MASLSFADVWKEYGEVQALRGLDLEVPDGELITIVGPSGCGKSTALRSAAGLEEVTRGAISIGGRDVTKVPAGKRNVSMVFQSYALFPHLTVKENIGFGLAARRVPKQTKQRRVQGAAELVGCAHLFERHPYQLSGGERQRVALARALVRRPDVYLLDEPLSNLDAQLRVRMRAELKQLHQRLGSTMVYVTHDQVEALTLGDRVAVLNEGVAPAGGDADRDLPPAGQSLRGHVHRQPGHERPAPRERGRRVSGGPVRPRPARISARRSSSSASARSRCS